MSKHSFAICSLIRIGGSPDAPPISYAIREDRLRGIGFDFVRQILPKQTHVEIAKPMPWLRAIHWTRDGHIDLLVGLQSTHYPPEWFTYLEPPLTTSAHSVFYRRRELPLRNLHALLPLRGATLRGAKSATHSHSGFDLSQLTLTTADSVEKALKMLALDRIDYFIAPQWHAISSWLNLYSEQSLPLAMLPEPVHINPVYLALSNQSPCLADKEALEAAIIKAKREGLMEALLEQSFLYSNVVDQFHDLLR
ncbi:substrate-binding periplasmic protein [Pseudoalteromonas rubra]|uniref:Uncharacterized protein n=1 Tax=Pseudoalteromonas rubra TaxID=43658 RepID=A0A0F4QZ32_9GAMM|nr:transporter substrate-binding domain-containing protein [Pseudoalteromonas rubra]KJZ12963.1 hypothetical protein TW77_01005 [Pseudoalteromonas rubra]